MRKFHFSLEAVGRVRKNKEQDALRSLATAQRALQIEKERKEGLVSLLHESFERREKFGMIAMQPMVVQIEESFITGTKQKILHTEQAIARASRAVEKAMAHYLACRQQRMMMDKLREKDLEKFKEALRKKEIKEADDMNIMRARMEKGVA